MIHDWHWTGSSSNMCADPYSEVKSPKTGDFGRAISPFSVFLTDPLMPFLDLWIFWLLWMVTNGDPKEHALG
jgi:hypothetical protein